MWIILKGLSGGDLGLLNIYAPNDSSDRIPLWDSVRESLPQSCCWIFGGDFNMVESLADKSSSCTRIVCDSERRYLNFAANSRRLNAPFTSVRLAPPSNLELPD